MMKRLLLLCIVILALAGCGGGAASNAPTPLPSSTPIPTFQFIPPTEPAAIATAAASTEEVGTAEAVALDPEMVERGRDRYVVLECGSCHGENGEGTEEGSALAGTTLSEADFITYLRTGGDIGNDHLYSTDRLSERGGRNLYAYVLSLSAGS
jgi:mono/diheme cytochrome c family protein